MRSATSVMWGKSSAAGSMHLLLAHLLDTAAVGELIWDRYLAPGVRCRLDACSDGQGRLLLSLLCALHDVGKATPAFQSKDVALGQCVQEAGFGWRLMSSAAAKSWPHTLAGARILLDEFGGADEGVRWLWPIVAGHHGRVPAAAGLIPKDSRAHGRGEWRGAQNEFVERVLVELGADRGFISGLRWPPRALQLVLSGLVVMADWIASNDQCFGGIADLAQVSMDSARSRAARAWSSLDLRGGWSTSALAITSESLIESRFGYTARAAQRDVIEAAETLVEPGLLVVEAPMGEGKTEAALAAAEVLARRFGADGIFVGMPTQATSDPLFARVRRWLSAIDSEVPVALLHGRSRFNSEWAQLRRQSRFTGVSDEFDLHDPYGPPDGSPSCCTIDGRAAAEWFLGRKRGLLTPVAVGTVDQLLYAATRTRHVMLRQAGLAGRVVVLDEVHAYDVFMSQFLFEALRWLAEAGVPVVLLSATLPPAQREQLVRAYAQGVSGVRDVNVSLPEVRGYPRTTVVAGRDECPSVECTTSKPARESLLVRLSVLDESSDFDPTVLAHAVIAALSGGGRGLVVCNTVARAQAVYSVIREAFGADAVLVHARLTAVRRAERTERLVTELGPRARRPERLVIVATQVAEQSFDVDVDILFTDLAPVDLVLQRIGRLHRHERAVADRPESLREPKVVLCGVRFSCDGPVFPAGSRSVYGEYLLLRAAALVQAGRNGWLVPDQVPQLVAEGYADEPIGPPQWASRLARAHDKHSEENETRAFNAAQFLLAGENELGKETLEGLHERHASESVDLDDEDAVAVVVRDGDPSVEVVLVRRDRQGYRTLGGHHLGPGGEGVSDEKVLEEVTGSVVRLPARLEITKAALQTLRPLPGWGLDPWLSRTRALVLDDDEPAQLGGHLLSYDDDLGLLVERH